MSVEAAAIQNAIKENRVIEPNTITNYFNVVPKRKKENSKYPPDVGKVSCLIVTSSNRF